MKRSFLHARNGVHPCVLARDLSLRGLKPRLSGGGGVKSLIQGEKA